MTEKDYRLAGEWRARLKSIYIKYGILIGAVLALTLISPIILLIVNYHLLLFFNTAIITILLILIILSIAVVIPVALMGPFIFFPEKYEALKIVYSQEYIAFKKLQDQIFTKKAEAYQLKKEAKLEKAISKINK